MTSTALHHLPAEHLTAAVSAPLTDAQRTELAQTELTPEQHAKVLAVVRENRNIGTVDALRQAGIDRPKRELKILIGSLDPEELRLARGWDLHKVEDTLWSMAVDRDHREVYRAALLLLRAYGDGRFQEKVEHEHTGGTEVTNPDVVAALDRFTSQVVRLAERGRAELTAGGPSR